MTKRLKQAGFTIIELILVISLIGLIAGAGAMAFPPALNTWSLVASRNEAVHTSQYALDRMIAELSQLKNAQSVLTANATEFEFIDLNDNNIHYQLTGNLLMRNGDVLCRGIQGLTFEYWDYTHAPLATPQVNPVSTNIWTIGVKVTDQAGDQVITLASHTHPRNLPRPWWLL